MGLSKWLFVLLWAMQSAHAEFFDPFLYLEEANGREALAWAKAQNEKTLSILGGDPNYEKIRKKVAELVFAKDQIPSPSLRGGKIYNLWQDEQNVRGLWRRTSIVEYAKTNSKWETVLDLDKLAIAENENWVWESVDCLAPEQRHCMLELSRGGKDTAEFREFDSATKSFVEDGFFIPEAKSGMAWLDEDHILVGSDFGPGTTTDSGYPRILKLWKRGTSLNSAQQIFSGQSSSVEVKAFSYNGIHGNLVVIVESTSFFTNDIYLMDAKSKLLKKLPLPKDIQLMGLFHEQLILVPRTDWQINGSNFPAGALVSLPVKNAIDLNPHLIYLPSERGAVEEIAITKDSVFFSVLDNVKGKFFRTSFIGGKWISSQIAIPDAASISILPSDSSSDLLLVQLESFLIPQSIFAIQSNTKTGNEKPEILLQMPEKFDGSGLVAEQLEATSRDGTKIPYFIVHKKDLRWDGSTPTIQLGYGGFGASEKPYYLLTEGKIWLEAGGAFVLANIRGGGEFGPRWHSDAIQDKKQRSFDDFISVSENLIQRKITSPKHLAIIGGSNGGLLVGAAFVQRPDLYGAVICQVPILDMIRYPLLGAGASWIEEYGDPNDADMREAILNYSPYQNVREKAKYPEVFFETSTQDDRVHPAHARKMAALMELYGNHVYFFENIEGGHNADANLHQSVDRISLEYTYLFRKVVKPESR